MSNSNPNGSNQYNLDPRQKLCWDLYINPKSTTFGNGLQSAIKAGYDDEYAEQITTRPWFLEKVRRLNLLNKAERNLDNILDLPLEEKANLVLDASKFVAKTLGKEEGYSERTELTGKDGEQLQPQTVLVKFIEKNEQPTNDNPDTNGIQTTI
jgi:hypothetical protein